MELKTILSQHQIDHVLRNLDRPAPIRTQINLFDERNLIAGKQFPITAQKDDFSKIGHADYSRFDIWVDKRGTVTRIRVLQCVYDPDNPQAQNVVGKPLYDWKLSA